MFVFCCRLADLDFSDEFVKRSRSKKKKRMRIWWLARAERVDRWLAACRRQTQCADFITSAPCLPVAPPVRHWVSFVRNRSSTQSILRVPSRSFLTHRASTYQWIQYVGCRKVDRFVYASTFCRRGALCNAALARHATVPPNSVVKSWDLGSGPDIDGVFLVHQRIRQKKSSSDSTRKFWFRNDFVDSFQCVS